MKRVHGHDFGITEYVTITREQLTGIVFLANGDVRVGHGGRLRPRISKLRWFDYDSRTEIES